jgi:hypothetical protein
VRRRRSWTILGFVLFAVCPGCVWLRNEFFVYDVPPPQVELEPARGADAP